VCRSDAGLAKGNRTVTLSQIETAVYRRTGYADAPSTEVVTRVEQWINIWHQRLLARPGMELLRDITVTFPSAVGQTQYTLAATVRRIKKIYEATTPLALDMMTIYQIREMDAGLNAKGIPRIWAPVTWAAGSPLAQLVIQLWPTPQQIITYNVDANTTAVDMASSDTPLLPAEYHWLLIEAGCYEEWLRKADTRAGTARQDMETGFKEMRNWLSNPYDYKPSNLPTIQQPSRLGGMYPPW